MSANPAENAPSKSHYSTHPPWTNMITECITTTPDGTKHGVSRPVIKKFVDYKYHLPMNAAVIGQLNRAIVHGTHNGNFVLPKGPSGKVKLAPKRVGETAKEKPPWKRSTVRKARGTEKKPPVSTTTKTPEFAEGPASKIMSATRKYTSMAKKARLTPIPGRQIPARKATMKRSGIKRASIGSSVRTRAATRREAKLRKRENK